MSSPAPRSDPLAALGNAFYLGTSWTWVIGMLFPALILRDYGLWGFVAFAVPNVVGAAAMGFVLTPERAKGILERHKTACNWFSMVTMAFHFFVLLWLLHPSFGIISAAILLGSLLLCWFAHRKWGDQGRWMASLIVWLVSIGLFVRGASIEGAWSGASWELGRLGKQGLLAFLPASMLGFALCPYLDLTFLRARAETTRKTGRVAFTVGFGIVFCSMIFFTVCYGEQLWEFFSGHPLVLHGAWHWIILIHLSAQIGLTIAWHDVEMSRPKNQPLQFRILTGLFFGGALALAGIAHFHPDLGEPLYRSFLLLYGTILPAYVLLKMIPSRKPVSQRVRTWSFVCASLVSYPLAWGAFVLHHHWMILPCAGALTIAFLVAQFGPAKKDGEAQADAPAFKPEA